MITQDYHPLSTLSLRETYSSMPFLLFLTETYLDLYIINYPFSLFCLIYAHFYVNVNDVKDNPIMAVSSLASRLEI